MSFLFASQAVAMGILDGNDDDPRIHENVAGFQEDDDPFGKAFREREIEHIGGIDMQKFYRETAAVDNAHRQHYADLATAASAQEPIVDSKRLAKRASGARFEKSQNGKWLYEYSADGSMLSGKEIA
jgi:hypothetical protein